MKYKTDIEIARGTKLAKITDIAKKIAIDEDALELYGNYKAKIDVNKIKANKKAKVVLVTAINPTKAGEGKSTTTIGLADSMNKLGKQTTVVLREPSLGPVFGLKGGATGGGYAQVVPMEDINLHFTGDMHAITCANNLISACLDNHLYQGNELNIDKDRVVWKRCLDMNDRALRDITIGQGRKSNGVERKDGFIITVASEVMAVLCLAKDLDDLKERLANMLVAYTLDNQEVYVRDLKIAGALTLILKDAIKPNLVQTLEKTPAIIHGGPFANIAHGCNSIIATKTAMRLSDYVVTEAGFGADLGAEKFLNIKCREASIKPDCVVIVATVRALKLHGNVPYENLQEPNVKALLKGTENLAKHIDSIKSFNLPYVVCINRFVSDSDAEIVALENWCRENNHAVSISNVWECGSQGGMDLAKMVVEMCNRDNNFSYTYELNDSIETKIAKIAKRIYGASKVVYSPKALEQLKMLKQNGYEKYMICMAKTPLSLTDNPKLLGRPKDFEIHIKEFTISRGAGFIVCLTGKIMKMPGLPKVPAANNMDLVNGKITGLF